MQTKKVQVVILPTGKDGYEANQLATKYDSAYEVTHYKMEKYSFSGGIWKGQHIYFISDDEINQGDWYYSGMRTSTYGVHKCDTERLSKLANESKECSKIISSTDLSLGLPGIPESWIKDVYVPSNGSIKEVELELEFYYDKVDNVDYRGMLKLTNNEVCIVDSDTKEPKFNKSEWIFERSSGYRGYRNTVTQKWVYEDHFNEMCYRAGDENIPEEPESWEDMMGWKTNPNPYSEEDLLKLLDWIAENGWWTSEPMWCNGEDENYTEITSKELIELWKNK